MSNDEINSHRKTRTGHLRDFRCSLLPNRLVSASCKSPLSGAAAAKTPVTSTARHGPYLLYLLVRRLRVRPERHRAQSCAIALRSPAPERSSDIHQIFTSRRPSLLISALRFLETAPASRASDPAQPTKCRWASSNAPFPPTWRRSHPWAVHSRPFEWSKPHLAAVSLRAVRSWPGERLSLLSGSRMKASTHQ